MGAKSKRQKRAATIYDETRGYRRTRLNESNNVEHIHMELLKQGERIEQLRADLDKKKKHEIQWRPLLSAAEAKLERVVDSYSGPMRGMRKKVSKLKHTIRVLSEQKMVCNIVDDCSGDDADLSSEFGGEINRYFEEGDAP
jgi:hypothetical protein